METIRSFLGGVLSLFNSSAEIDDNSFEVPLSLEDTIEVLQKENENDNQIPTEEVEIPDNKCFEATGKVTHIDAHYGIIGKNLYFETPHLSKIKVGTVLHYLAYKKDGHTKISKILFEKKDNEWSEEVNSQPKDIVYASPVCKVIRRDGRIIVCNNGSIEDIEVNLDNVESEFVPKVGDYLQIRSIVEADDSKYNKLGRTLNITRITPLRGKIQSGIIQSYDRESQTGQINHDIIFFKDACAPGYVPLVNDRVHTEIIECQIGQYIWRSIRVVPSGASIVKTIVEPKQEDLELLKNKNDIVLTEYVCVNLQKLGEKQIISFQVQNIGEKCQTILGIQFKTSAHKSQMSLESPNLDSAVTVRAGQTIFLKILCEAKFMGHTKEMIVVSFDGFQIGRWLKVVVIPFYKMCGPARDYTKNTRNLAVAAWKSFQNANTKEIIVGQRPVKPPSFINNKLLSYEIPEIFARKVFGLMSENKLKDVRIKDLANCLECLRMENYTDFFHYLLYLEEIAVQVNIRKYDMPIASFIKDGDFLMLEVPDLSERRPSIIIGDKVLAFNPQNPESKPLEGHVHKTGRNHIYLKFNQNFHNVYNGEDYAVEFHSSRSNFRRYHQAVDLAVKNLGKKILFPSYVDCKEPQIQFSEERKDKDVSKYLSTAKKLLKNSQNGEKTENGESKSDSSGDANTLEVKPQPHRKSVKFADQSPPIVVKLEWFDKKLNNFQKAAVRNIVLGIARPLPYFIFGPPGTGKTVTLIETILQILRLIPHSRLLVCAPSNSAADLIAMRLLDSKILEPGDLVRMVAYRCIVEGSIPEKLLPFCVTGDLAREGSRENRNCMQNGVNTNLQASVLGRHRITVGTCMVVSVLYAMGFPRGHFTHIIVDEAGQATEPELMIPMSLLDVQTAQCVLAGDPMQLGPCVFSMVSKENGLGESYFERVMSNFPYSRDVIGFPETGGFDPRLVTKLVYNYRSLPELLTCPNNLFYQNELRPVISDTNSSEACLLRKISSVLPIRKDKLPPALVFHGVRGMNFQTSDCPSWFNPVEAGQIFYYINDLYRLGVAPQEIGVITPYIRQGQQVRELLHENGLDLPKIGSVEEFQGQEFKIVILSCVRSNEIDAQNDSKYGLGFISSPRRLNVAISRAQALLIIVGNPHLLVMDKYWRHVLRYAVEIEGYTGCDLPEEIKNRKE